MRVGEVSSISELLVSEEAAEERSLQPRYSTFSPFPFLSFLAFGGIICIFILACVPFLFSMYRFRGFALSLLVGCWCRFTGTLSLRSLYVIAVFLIRYLYAETKLCELVYLKRSHSRSSHYRLPLPKLHGTISKVHIDVF